MIERLAGRVGSWNRLAPFGLLALLSLAVVLPPTAPTVELANPDRSSAAAFGAALTALPNDARVLVGFDPDFGTYPEISYATRAALDALLRANASLAFVSYSPEGRALATAELDRLRRGGVSADRLLDLGYRSGAEAALVGSVASIVPSSATGRLADGARAAGGGIDAFALTLVVGGNDLDPRVWIEQVGTRLPKQRILAIAPTFLRPELEPYLHSGQLSALLGTLRDGVAYAAESGASAAGTSSDRPPSALAMLIGMLVGLGVLLESSGGRLLGVVRGIGWGDRR